MKEVIGLNKSVFGIANLSLVDELLGLFKRVLIPRFKVCDLFMRYHEGPFTICGCLRSANMENKIIILFSILGFQILWTLYVYAKTPIDRIEHLTWEDGGHGTYMTQSNI